MPRTLPSLLRAYEIGARVAAVGFDWERAVDVVAKIEEEVAELREAVEAGAASLPSNAEEEMGDLLFAIANLARKLGIEPEAALRQANDKFTRRFASMEATIRERGQTLQDCSPAGPGRRVDTRQTHRTRGQDRRVGPQRGPGRASPDGRGPSDLALRSDSTRRRNTTPSRGRAPSRRFSD